MSPAYAELLRLSALQDQTVGLFCALGFGLLLGWAALQRARPWLRQLYAGLIVVIYLVLSFQLYALRAAAR